MAVVDLNTNEWINSDGLKVLFGTDRARASRGGEFAIDGEGQHCVEVTIALASLPTVASGNVQIVADNVTIPNGALIEEVQIVATKAATSGGSATLDIGLVDQDFSTEIDFNGMVAALAKTAYDTVGEKNVIRVGSTGAGAQVGTKITNTGYIVANAGTADFTAGVVKVRIVYITPLTADL